MLFIIGFFVLPANSILLVIELAHFVNTYGILFVAAQIFAKEFLIMVVVMRVD